MGGSTHHHPTANLNEIHAGVPKCAPKDSMQNHKQHSNSFNAKKKHVNLYTEDMIVGSFRMKAFIPSIEENAVVVEHYPGGSCRIDAPVLIILTLTRN